MTIAPDLDAYLAMPEDIILYKMLYFREGGSERHLRDILGMLRISGAVVDRTYVDEWAAQLGLSTIWESPQEQAPPSKEPYAWFPDIVANPMTGAIVARECVDTFGPWMLDSYRPNVGMTLVRHPHYFVPGLPYTDRVELAINEDQASRMGSVRSALDARQPTILRAKTSITNAT